MNPWHEKSQEELQGVGDEGDKERPLGTACPPSIGNSHSSTKSKVAQPFAQLSALPPTDSRALPHKYREFFRRSHWG